MLGDHSHRWGVSSDVSGTPSWLASAQRARWQAGCSKHDWGLGGGADKRGETWKCPNRRDRRGDIIVPWNVGSMRAGLSVSAVRHPANS